MRSWLVLPAVLWLSVVLATQVSATAKDLSDTVLLTVSSGSPARPQHVTAKVVAPAAVGAVRWAWWSWASAGRFDGPACSGVLRDAAGLAAITVSLLIYGVLQERIMTIGFGPGSELFDNSIFLVLCNRLVTCCLAFGYMAATTEQTSPAAPMTSYAAVSLTNVVATTCQYEALKYVTFSMQTLAKSAKALPVMLWGTLYMNKRYRISDYLHACVITAGCTVFMLAGDISSRTQIVNGSQAQARTYLTGGGLMVLYLAVDGLTSTWQDSMFSGYNMSICDQVLYTTACSSLLSLIAAVATGQLLPSIGFVLRHPDALYWILALSLASAAVQLVISFTIKQYGAIVFATIMTTRQFFSILLSSVVFLTPLTFGQWLGSAVIFGAIYVKVFRSTRPAKPKSSPAVTPTARV